MVRAFLASLVAGLFFGILGFACAFAIFQNAQGEGWEAFPECAGVAASLTGFLSWWALLARPCAYSLRRGLLAGALVGLLSHPLAWYFAILVNYFSGAMPSGDEAMDPLQGLLGAVVFSLGSWACVGWLTLPLGMVAGAALTPLTKWFFGRKPEQHAISNRVDHQSRQ